MKSSSRVPTLYRIVELCRGRGGRLEKICSVWDADVNRIRAIGNFVASRTMAHRVWIATTVVPHLEEIPLPMAPYSTTGGSLHEPSGDPVGPCCGADAAASGPGSPITGQDLADALF